MNAPPFNAPAAQPAQASEPDRIETVAAEALRALDAGAQIAPFSTRLDGFTLEEGYRVAAAVRRMREARGEAVVGRKIGFTNRTIWTEYGVGAPIWGYVYDRTVSELAAANGTFSLGGLPEPRIEPEIVFGLARAPEPGMDEAALLDCIEWAAHGFEIVQSIFADWRFAPADTVAAFGLHGALLIGPRRAVAPEAGTLARNLSSFAIDLRRDGAVVDRGRATNVLDGPVLALKHLVEVLAADPVNPPLAAGEIVTTGTLTRALPVAPGETWSTALTGVALDGIAVRFA
jgi:2-oxo-3-hexenedioate decarboxylase